MMEGRADFYRMISVWRFDNAPGRLADLLKPGHRGRWVVSVPQELDGPELAWMRAMGPVIHRHPLGADVCYLVVEPVTQ